MEGVIGRHAEPAARKSAAGMPRRIADVYKSHFVQFILIDYDLECAAAIDDSRYTICTITR